jgi:sensor histidine kinase YesM
MKISQRYSFLKVFWVVLSVYSFFMLLGLIAVAMIPSDEMKLENILGLRHLSMQAISLGLTTLFFFVMLNVYHNLMMERRPVLHFIIVSAPAVLAIFAYHILINWLFPPSPTNKEKITQGIMIFSWTISSLFITGLCLLITYLNILRDEKKQRKVLEAQKMQLEVEKSQANLNFLKAQINPHFLHNTLNFLYAKSLPLSAELSEGILTLSDIMRYALADGNLRDGKAMLKDEIEHVRNVIKINQLRFSNNLNVNMEVAGVVNGATIIPFVLITLVENAFKHGDLKTRETPIDIRIHVDKKKLAFHCRNKKKSGPKELSTGVGLDNIRKRLELAYGNNYRFDIKDEAEFYTTELTIHSL